MQWNDNSHAGFTSSKPWLAVNENFKTINVEAQEIDPDSVLNYCRRMIELRKNHLILIYGAFALVDANNKQLFAYTRSLNNEQILVVLNFSDAPAPLNSSLEKDNKTILISNYEQPSINNLYQPYAAVIYKIGE
jgi:oligo-1,6-glucosidase